MKVTSGMREFAVRLAAIFPDWEIEDNESHWAVYLKHKKIPHARMVVDCDLSCNRFIFCGLYPTDLGNPEISVSQNRDDIAIAKDVHRRLLTKYLERLPSEVKKMQQAKQAKIDYDLRVQNFAKEVGGSTVMRSYANAYINVPGVHEVRPNHDATEFIIKTYYIPAEAAKRIIDIIREYK